MREFWTAERALSAVLSGFQPGWPLAPSEVASSETARLILNLPARPWAWLSASFSALMMLCDWSACGPCSGRLEKTVANSPATRPPVL